MFNIDQETQEKIMEMVRSHLDEILTNTLNDKKRVNAITEIDKRLRPEYVEGLKQDRNKIKSMKKHIKVLNEGNCVSEEEKKYSKVLEECCCDTIIDLATKKWIDSKFNIQTQEEFVNIWESIIQSLVKTENKKGQFFTNGRVLSASEINCCIENRLFFWEDEEIKGVPHRFHRYYCNPEFNFMEPFITMTADTKKEFLDICEQYNNGAPLDEIKVRLKDFFFIHENFGTEMEKEYSLYEFEYAKKLFEAKEHAQVIDVYYQYYIEHPEKEGEYSQDYAWKMGSDRYLGKTSIFYIYWKKRKLNNVRQWLEENHATEILELYNLFREKLSLDLFLLMIGIIKKEDYWFISGQITSTEYEKWNEKISFEAYVDGFMVEMLHRTSTTRQSIFSIVHSDTRENRMQDNIRRIAIRNVFSPENMKNWLLFYCLDRLISDACSIDFEKYNSDKDFPFCKAVDIHFTDRMKNLFKVSGDLRFVKKKEVQSINSAKPVLSAEVAEKQEVYIVYKHQLPCLCFLSDADNLLNRKRFFQSQGKALGVHTFGNIVDAFISVRTEDDTNATADSMSYYYLNQFLLFDSAVELTYGCFSKFKSMKGNDYSDKLETILDRIVELQDSVKCGMGKLIKECFLELPDRKFSKEDAAWFLEQMSQAFSCTFCRSIIWKIKWMQEEFYARLLANGWDFESNPFQYRGEIEWKNNYTAVIHQLIEEDFKYYKEKEKKDYINQIKKHLYQEQVGEILNLLYSIWDEKKETTELYQTYIDEGKEKEMSQRITEEIKAHLLISNDAWRYLENYTGTLYRKIQGQLIEKKYNLIRDKKKNA